MIARRRGFSATEVMIATALLALALLPVLGLFSGGTRQTAQQEYQMAALNIAGDLCERVIEKILSESFEAVAKLPEGTPTDIAETPYAISTEDFDFFEKPSIFQLDKVHLTLVRAGLVQITVEISWKPGSGAPGRNIRFHRLFSRPEASMTTEYVPKQETRL